MGKVVSPDQVLPPENPNVSRGHISNTTLEKGKTKISPAWGNLQPIAAQLKTEFEFYERLEKQAASHAIRIGMLLRHAKHSLKHGEFMDWLEQNVACQKTHAYRFMKLAKIFMDKYQIQAPAVKQLCAAQPAEKGITGKLFQQVFDFIGDKSQADLFEEYGIKSRERKLQGGDNVLTRWLRENGHAGLEGTPRANLPPDVALEFEAYGEQCKREGKAIEGEMLLKKYERIFGEMYKEVVERKTYMHLKQADREYFFGMVIDIHRELKGSFNERLGKNA